MTINKPRGASQYVGIGVLILGALLLIVVAIDQGSIWPVVAAVAVLIIAALVLGYPGRRSR